MRTLILIVGMILLAGCGEGVMDEPPVDSLKATATAVVDEPLPTVDEPPVEPLREGILLEGGDFYGRDGPATLEELLAASPIIVRATIASVTTVGVLSVYSLAPGPLDQNRRFEGYIGSLEFTFDVIEYLKGSGGSQVKGVAYGYPRSGHEGLRANTKSEAAELARPLLDARDKRWDDREAIIFLREAPTYGKEYLSQYLDHYWMGQVSIYPGTNRQVTVASGEAKVWLPDASSSSPQRTEPSATEQDFLLEDPGDDDVDTKTTQTTTGEAARSITLVDLKAKISDLEAQVAAGGGSQEYRDCLAATLRENRLSQGAVRYTRIAESFESGLAAGTTVYVVGYAVQYHLQKVGPTEPAAGAMDHWHEGRDAHLFGHRYPGYTYVKRPLPAGEYRAFAVWRRYEMVICDGQPEALRGKYEHVFTVTAPAGTLAEAFFDPVSDGDAVSGTTTVGPIGWEDGEVEATLTQDVTGHALDFIALDGTISLSLAAASATSTAGTLSWAVPTQPWEDGDQLMLRIRRAAAHGPSVTVTLSPREEQHSTGTDITIEWSDPDACDSQYFVGVYNNEELYRAERILGYYPAPATTTLTADLHLSWDRVPSHDWWVGVTCAPSDGSGWSVMGKASLQSGLPSATEPPTIAVSDLGATLENGQGDGFTVSASNLDATASYTIRVTTDDADLGFDSGCTDRQEDVTVSAESTSHTATLTLHGCATPGGTVTATLLSGGATVDTATQDVTVPNTPATGAPTISGTVQAGETLTADTSGIADADGLDNVSYSYQWTADDADIVGATDSTYTLSDDEVGKVIEVRVRFNDDAGSEEALTSAATVAVGAAPVVSPLTASFENAPASHDGQNSFTFEVRFSEEASVGFRTLRDHAFSVTGGTVTSAGRLEQGSNLRWQITIQPESDSDVTIALPATTDCTAQGAICTTGGKMLSEGVEITVSGP